MQSLVEEHKIQTITSPKVILRKRNPLTVSIVFVERPKVIVKEMEKIKVERKEPKVSAEDVQKMVEFILRKHETTKEVDRPAREKDRITVDFTGSGSDGKDIPGIHTTGHAVILGSKTLIPGFEEALLGLKKGEEKTFTLTFPKDYHAKELSEKPVTFHATVTKVEEVTIPELTDAFAKEHLHAESAAAFREELRRAMVREEERLERARREQQLFDAIVRATDVDLAPELVEEEAQDILEDLRGELQRQNRTLEDWMKATGKKPEELEKELAERAGKRLKLRLGIRELLEVKQITVSDEEIAASVKALLEPLSEKERREVELAYCKGEKAYEQLKWQKKVEKLVEGMLKV
jgi:trigger factor